MKNYKKTSRIWLVFIEINTTREYRPNGSLKSIEQKVTETPLTKGIIDFIALEPTNLSMVLASIDGLLI